MHPRIFVYDCVSMLFLGMCLGENMFVCVYVWCVSFVSVCLGGCFVGVYIYSVYVYNFIYCLWIIYAQDATLAASES